MIATKAVRAGRASTSRIRPSPIANSESTIEATERKPGDHVGRGVAAIRGSVDRGHARTPSLPRAGLRGDAEPPPRPGACGRSGRRCPSRCPPRRSAWRGRVGHDADLGVGRRGLRLDRVPDDDADVDEGDFENQQHENDLPDHGVVSLRDRPARPARRRISCAAATFATPPASASDEDPRAERRHPGRPLERDRDDDAAARLATSIVVPPA